MVRILERMISVTLRFPLVERSVKDNCGACACEFQKLFDGLCIRMPIFVSCVCYWDIAFRLHGGDNDAGSLGGEPGLHDDGGELLFEAVLVADNTGISNDHWLRNLEGLFACLGSESIHGGLDHAALLSE